MSWLTYHRRSEELATSAQVAITSHEFKQAEQLYIDAAKAEMNAYASLEPTKSRTLGITAVSAASLLFKGRDFARAQSFIHKCLATQNMPPFAVEQLQSLLQTIWSEESRDRSGIEFIRGEVLVSIRGGEVVYGGAPLDLILNKVEEVGKLFYRTIEMLMGRDFRRRGAPSLEVQEQCKPWLFQAPAGSYQFAVRVQKPKQLSLFPNGLPEVEEITQKFLDIVEAGSQGDQEQLAVIIPDEQYIDAPKYRDAFLRLTRNLAPSPSNNSFQQLEIKSSDNVDSTPLVLVQSSREAINRAIKKEKLAKEALSDEYESISLRGVLRGLQLDKDWIEVSVDGSSSVKIYETGDVIDDVVGPMVNRRVIVDVLQSEERYLYRDIQLND